MVFLIMSSLKTNYINIHLHYFQGLSAMSVTIQLQNLYNNNFSIQNQLVHQMDGKSCRFCRFLWLMNKVVIWLFVCDITMNGGKRIKPIIYFDML